MSSYDVVTVGGGIGGSALALAMAGGGYRVLVLERDVRFLDRVRGEFIFPWGVAEAKALGLYDALKAAGGHHPTYWVDYAGPIPLPVRDFAEDTPQRVRGLSIHHPRMQEAALSAAESAGAEVWRGVRVRQVEPGSPPTVIVEGGAGSERISARLVVGADGRSSMARKSGGFESRQDPPGNVIAGVLLERVAATADRSICMVNPEASRMVLYFPQTEDTGRAYLVSRSDDGLRLHGAADVGTFLKECVRSGLPPELFEGASAAGPLASFDGADSWVERPYQAGVALIGDAAATSDPTWGQGLSLTLRDARTLRDALLGVDDWDTACHAVAIDHDRCFDRIRTAESWFTRIFLEPGPDADALRGRVLPQMESDPFFLPDTIFSGPDMAPPTAEHWTRIGGGPQRHDTPDPLRAVQ
jgi:menaquinone-9 beta-reductase